MGLKALTLSFVKGTKCARRVRQAGKQLPIVRVVKAEEEHTDLCCLTASIPARRLAHCLCNRCLPSSLSGLILCTFSRFLCVPFAQLDYVELGILATHHSFVEEDQMVAAALFAVDELNSGGGLLGKTVLPVVSFQSAEDLSNATEQLLGESDSHATGRSISVLLERKSCLSVCVMQRVCVA